jgi:hypothetical protein
MLEFEADRSMFKGVPNIIAELRGDTEDDEELLGTVPSKCLTRLCLR